MQSADTDADWVEAHLERRWFACMTAVKALEAEGDLLRQVLEITQATWRRNRAEIMRLEALRDAFGEKLECTLTKRDERSAADSAPSRAPRLEATLRSSSFSA